MFKNTKIKLLWIFISLILSFMGTGADSLPPGDTIVPGYCTWINLKMPDGRVVPGVFKALGSNIDGDGEYYVGFFYYRPIFDENNRAVNRMEFMITYLTVPERNGAFISEDWVDVTVPDDMSLQGDYTTTNHTKLDILAFRTGFCQKGLVWLWEKFP